MNKIIKIEKINKFYGDGESRVHILKDISLEIEQGDFVAIIGQSGSGKSTLMNIIGCLDRASNGSYKIDDKEIADFSSEQLSELRQKKFGFIFQRYNLITTIDAKENVALPALYAGESHKNRLFKAVKLLEKLGLSGKENNKPNQLSGGQQQRVSIARALMNGGEIILADEPTGALDSKSGEMVMEILTQLHSEGHTIILVTHDKNIANFAGRVIEIRDGEICQDIRNFPLKSSNKKINNIENKNSFKVQFLEAFKMAINSILAHKMRALLTMLGIIIGITSIICVVALGNGSQQQILNNISSLGTNTIDIFNGKGMGDRESQKKKNLTIEDCEFLKKQPYIDSITPNVGSSGEITYENITLNASLKGIGNEYFEVKGVSVGEGRKLSNADIKNIEQVALIDENTQKQLFNNENPIGKIILFNKKPLTVIGTIESSNNMAFKSSDLNIYIPYTTVMYKITGDNHISSITAKIKDNMDMQLAEKEITDILTVRHREKDFFILNSDTLKNTIESTTNTMKLLISCIACISLVVGGIGVMNIMLVSVTERTKEIGIRMAIGAKQKNILQQFLIEAILICLLGGTIGVILALIITGIFNLFVQNFTMIISISSIIVGVVCSTLIGVIFGYIPAKNAGELDPINALSRD